MGHLSEIVVFPIKSCKGISTQAATLTNAGLRWDREWMVVKATADEEGRHKFVTIRQESKLALVVPSLPASALSAPLGSEPEAGAAMTVTAPGQAKPLQVALARPQKAALKSVEIWDWKGTGHDEGEEAAAFFTAYLGFPARLVRYLGSASAGEAPDVVRPTDTAYAPGHEVRFADAFPILVASEGALADVNARLAEAGYTPIPPAPALPLTMSRFRPNLVIGGTGAWEEDKWAQLKVSVQGGSGGQVELLAVKPCDRCKVPTVDPATAEKSGGEPYDVLTTFRKGSQLGFSVKQWTHAVFFGQNLVVTPDSVGKTLRVGDAVEFASPAKQW
eukprot:CAMPEP_0202864952 /NCGR_PEP_ID=MMETSP1391-20130828/4975_1 /ASSEMBLY_ACC=CAM_ASM_000867 /TAXON_ID=1034604 /ORGANISM="Chlamydomonas leiostraca, Strain SAG 11-49" /LENGTH=331 /DNA_ID=CAMNT_0049544731 /DNA_START=102 /DNA_END=1097 /DNA_ORIENTATION=-